MDKDFIIPEKIYCSKRKMLLEKLKIVFSIMKSKRFMIFLVDGNSFHSVKFNITSQQSITMCDVYCNNENQNAILENKVNQLVENA